MRGYLEQFDMIVPFSVENSSGGRPSEFHLALRASEVNSLTGLAIADIGIPSAFMKGRNFP
jgi:hypothetical protein